MYACMYVCVYAYTCICVYIYIYIYIYIYVDTHLFFTHMRGQSPRGGRRASAVSKRRVDYIHIYIYDIIQYDIISYNAIEYNII